AFPRRVSTDSPPATMPLPLPPCSTGVGGGEAFLPTTASSSPSSVIAAQSPLFRNADRFPATAAAVDEPSPVTPPTGRPRLRPRRRPPPPPLAAFTPPLLPFAPCALAASPRYTPRLLPSPS
ncbi:unnamed protein product, partial [Ectocarpus fasciculatus]